MARTRQGTSRSANDAPKKVENEEIRRSSRIHSKEQRAKIVYSREMFTRRSKPGLFSNLKQIALALDTEYVSFRSLPHLLRSAIEKKDYKRIHELASHERMPGKSLIYRYSHDSDQCALLESFMSSDPMMVLRVLQLYIANKDRVVEEALLEPKQPPDTIELNMEMRESLLKTLIERGIISSMIDLFRAGSDFIENQIHNELSSLYPKPDIPNGPVGDIDGLLYSSDDYPNYVVHALRCGNADLALALATHPSVSDKNALTLPQLSVLRKSREHLNSMSLMERSNTVEKITLQHVACVQGDDTVLQWLDASNSSLFSVKDEDGWGCIHYAACSNTDVALKFLLSKEFGVDEKNNKGETALHIAVRTGRFENIKILLAAIEERDKLTEDEDDAERKDKSLVNARDGRGRTPLHYAPYYKGLSNFGSLVRYPLIDLNIKDSDNRTALMIAAINDNFNLCAILTTKQNVKSIVDEHQRSPLLLAVLNGKDSTVDFLIRAGFSTCHRDKDGNTAMHYACMHGWMSIVRYLIEFDKHLKNKKGYTPLELAFRSGHYGIIIWAINNGYSQKVDDEISKTVYDWIGKQDCTTFIEI